MTVLACDIRLVLVPKEQKDWFNKHHGFISDCNFPTDGAEFDMLKNNIFGNNDRFIDYNGNSQGLIDGFWMGYSAGGTSTSNTKYFIEIIISIMGEAIEMEYYEIAQNIKVVHGEIVNYISECEENIDKYYDDNSKEKTL
jgi:hypothetical protein